MYNYLLKIKSALDHIWIGGRTVMFNDGWEWVDENDEVLTRDNLGAGSSWCFDKNDNSWPHADHESCLNLDREGHGTPLFYGLPCNTSQYVLCNLSTRTNMDLAAIEVNETKTEEGMGKIYIRLFIEIKNPIRINICAK